MQASCGTAFAASGAALSMRAPIKISLRFPGRAIRGGALCGGAPDKLVLALKRQQAHGRIQTGARGGTGCQMVFLPDDAESAQSDDDESGSPSETSQSEWDDRNAIIHQYSPITGTSLETPAELNEKLRPVGLDRHSESLCLYVTYQYITERNNRFLSTERFVADTSRCRYEQ